MRGNCPLLTARMLSRISCGSAAWEPRKIYFDGVEGFLAVPEEASSLAEVGWSVNIVLARLAGRWRVVEVDNVYPY